MLTDTEHDGRETVLLSLLVAAVVVVIAVVREKVLGTRRAAVGDAVPAAVRDEAGKVKTC